MSRWDLVAEALGADSEYEAHAVQTAKALGLLVTAAYDGYRPHFAGETVSRDVYRVTLFRPNGHGKKQVSFLFGQSEYATRKGEKPGLYDILASLTCADPGTFEEFSAEYGPAPDVAGLNRMWRDAKKEWSKLCSMFTPDEIELLRDVW